MTDEMDGRTDGRTDGRNAPPEHALHDVGAVEVVHAVGAHHSLLHAQHHPPRVGVEPTVPRDGLAAPVEDPREVLPPHLRALLVEVEPQEVQTAPAAAAAAAATVYSY